MSTRVKMCGLLSLAGLALVLLWAGHGHGPLPNQVFGKVTFNGKPLTSGSVKFVHAGGEETGSAIDREGNYCIDNLPPGPVQVAVYSHSPNPFQPSAARVLAIPKRYQSPAESGLRLRVPEGRTCFNIDLKP